MIPSCDFLYYHISFVHLVLFILFDCRVLHFCATSLSRVWILMVARGGTRVVDRTTTSAFDRTTCYTRSSFMFFFFPCPSFSISFDLDSQYILYRCHYFHVDPSNPALTIVTEIGSDVTYGLRRVALHSTYVCILDYAFLYARKAGTSLQ